MNLKLNRIGVIGNSIVDCWKMIITNVYFVIVTQRLLTIYFRTALMPEDFGVS